ncbi:hypothetical protein [Paenibacillus bovis]|uniref:Uncharacterized protein n=1 Tax=Paenibacillus bovis TaxID=1616788 RepID=A0A1X9T3Z2_9BACL|nr:hypothetical protein [Paenibacillus bovis]ARR10690.1 hypothetical protein AR543_p0082 [Paenibacillus bovis]
MAQRAYLNYFDGWKEQFPSATLQEMGDELVIELDSSQISAAEVLAVRNMHKKGLRTPFCAICQTRLVYDKGFIDNDRSGMGSHRAPSFKHLKRDCFRSESLPHAYTKRFVFSRLETAGYRVFEDMRPFGAQQLQADVAAYQKENGEEELRMVVEVLATPPKVPNMIRKMNTFATESVPTAWVLLLDSFFDKRVVGGVTRMVDPTFLHEVKYKVTPIEPGQNDNFVVAGKENAAFSFLIQNYGYVIGVFQPGYVFFIRRDPRNEEERQYKLLKGQTWDSADDLFVITRMADKDLVPTLLYTPVLTFAEQAAKRPLQPGAPRELQEQDMHAIVKNSPNEEANVDIDFEAAKLVGEEAELAYNPLQLIQESRQAREAARIRYEEDIAREEAQKAVQELQNEEVDQQAAGREQSESADTLEINQLDDRSYEEAELLASDPDYPPNIRMNERKEWAPFEYPMNYKQREQVTYEIQVRGYTLAEPDQLLHCSEAEGLQIVQAMKDGRIENSPLELIRNEQTITEAYAHLDDKGRLAMGHFLYPEGLAEPWFFTMTTKQKEKDQQKMKRLQKLQRQQDKQKKGVPEDQERFDF